MTNKPVRCQSRRTKKEASWNPSRVPPEALAIWKVSWVSSLVGKFTVDWEGESTTLVRRSGAENRHHHSWYYCVLWPSIRFVRSRATERLKRLPARGLHTGPATQDPKLTGRNHRVYANNTYLRSLLSNEYITYLHLTYLSGNSSSITTVDDNHSQWQTASMPVLNSFPLPLILPHLPRL